MKAAYVSEIMKKSVQLVLFNYTPAYKVYRGYIVFAFSVTMFVCLSACKKKFRQKFSQELLYKGL